MKRFFTTILALVYLLSCSGLLMHQHYCMGELVEEKLSLLHEDAAHECDKCGMEQRADNGCCEQKTQLLKKAADQQVEQIKALPLPVAVHSPALLPQSWMPAPCPDIDAVTAATIRSWQKPPPPELPLFLAYNNLRI